MNIREKQEKAEEMMYSGYAVLSCQTRGRDRAETECIIRTCFQRDRDRILHSKAFRRLKDKTQVFLAPKGDHYRTRMTHTLEVSQNARTIARALNLNEMLTEAIALGHDLGHTPFGHSGERALNHLCSDGFKHELQSIRVVECIEKDGRGLNLTWEVRDGMKNHSTSSMPSTLEGKIVRLADKIAYINHDVDDSIRAKIIRESDLPEKSRKILGSTVRERMNTMILDIVEHSENENDILMSDQVHDAMYDLRTFLFERVYQNEPADSEEEKVYHIMEPLFHYYMERPELLPAYSRERIGKSESRQTAVCDYIAGMTDHFAVETYKELFIPKFWTEK